MRTRRSAVTRTIDIPTFQAAVVRNCSPTLASIKPASLFTYPGVYANQNGKPGAAHIEGRRSRLLAVIAQCNRELQPLGIHMSVLVWRPCGALIYVYRPADLMRYLSDPAPRRRLPPKVTMSTTCPHHWCISPRASRWQAEMPQKAPMTAASAHSREIATAIRGACASSPTKLAIFGLSLRRCPSVYRPARRKL